MDNSLPKDRLVLEQFEEFNPAPSPSSPLRIQSICVSTTSNSQTVVHIGTKGGKIILLSVDHAAGTAEVLRSTSVGVSSVDTIQILVEIGRLLVVSDGVLFLLDPLLLRPAQRLGQLKGVTAVSKRLRFADSASSDPLGEVAARAEHSSRGQRLLHKLGSGIRPNGTGSMQRDGTRSNCFVAAAVVGKGLVLMELLLPEDIDSGISWVAKDVQGFDRVRTMVWVDDSVIVGTTEGYTLFSICNGHVSTLFSLPESSQPPLLIPLFRSKEVLLTVDNVGIIINSQGQPVGGSLIFRGAPDSITEMSSYLVASRKDSLELYKTKTGSCLQSITVPKVFADPCLVSSDAMGSGEILAVVTSSKVIFFRRISFEEQIKDLLRKRYYKEAISLVEELEVEQEMTKEMLSIVHAQIGFLLLFDLHFEEAVNHFLMSESMQPSEIFPFIMQDPNRWSLLIPRNRYWGLHSPPKLLEQVVDDGLRAIQWAMSLKKAGVGTAVTEAFLANPPSKTSLLESAIRNIIRYLLVCRDKELNLEVREGVDTLLMYLYKSLNLIDDMELLASSPNNCLVEELETLLDESGHLRTLAFLYASKEMNAQALAIWRLLARNYSSGLWKDPAILADPLNDSTIVSGVKTAAIEASKLLEKSSDQELILQHLGWIADEDQETAVRILTSEKREHQLSPSEVLATIDHKKVEIHQRYLEWLIEDQGSEDVQLHTMYALSLAASAVEALEKNSSDKNPAMIKQHMYISCSEEGEMIACSIREKLQEFLQSSDLYDAEEVLELLGETELWLEKAILYRKLGQETLVLQILALKLEDSEAAERYCVEIGRPDIYMQLLDLYLDAREGKEPMLNEAVRLLHNHGNFLDPTKVLQKLSPKMPLQLASNTLLRMLRAQIHHRLQGQIVRNISSALSLEAQLARLEERSRHVQINDETLCSSCHTRLGTKLLAMYPDDTVVCYKCYRRLGESTTASGRNFKQDIIFKPGWLVMRET